MNRNHLKIIACLSMLADHIGVLLFPQIAVLRWIGRLAMPLFAFFIGEGCRYTKNRKKYFLSVFLLGLGCQLVYLVSDLIEHGGLYGWSDAWYLNILLTFSCSVPLGYCLVDLKAALREKNRERALRSGALLAFGLTRAVGVNCLFSFLQTRGVWLEFDYGLFGMLLPLFALPFDGKWEKLACFTAGTLVYCIGLSAGMPFIWFSMLAPVLLAFYNGKPGSKRLKYGFYIFYPAHLALLYVISLIFF